MFRGPSNFSPCRLSSRYTSWGPDHLVVGPACLITLLALDRHRDMNLTHETARRLLFVLLLLIFAAHAVDADQILVPSGSAHRPLLKSIYAGCYQVEDFFDQQTKAVAFVFISHTCPVAQQYLPRLNEMYRSLYADGIRFIGVYSNSRVDLQIMARHAQDADIQFPVMLDYEHRLADLLDVQVIPEVVVLDASQSRRYQGAIDNQFKKRGRNRVASEHYLADALQAIITDMPVERGFAAPSGCRVERNPRPLPQHEITYHRDIAPLMQKNCQSCHRPGEVAPFELLTYEDAYYNAETIAEVVEERRMPPWHAYLNPKFGQLNHDARLSEKEISTIMAWVRAGAPEGDPQDAPPPITWPDTKAWTIGRPDFEYKIPKPFPIPKTGVLDYQFWRVPMDFPEERWVQAVEVKPGNPEVVHHITMHLVKSSDKNYSTLAGMLELYGFDNQGAVMVGDYVPGDPYRAQVFGPGRALRMPAGSDLIFELHYTPNNREATTDQSMVGIRWSDQPPVDEIESRVFRKPVGRFEIPPHEYHYRMEDSYYFDHDVEIDAIRAHFHLRGKSYRLEIVHRDETTGEVTDRETVFSIPVWDLDWQRTYELATPLRVEAGTELVAVGHFDNSRWNPNNPDPDATVYWGQQTADEMFNTRFIVRRAPEVTGEAGEQ